MCGVSLRGVSVGRVFVWWRRCCGCCAVVVMVVFFCSEEWDARAVEQTALLYIKPAEGNEPLGDAVLAKSTQTLREGLTQVSNAISTISLSFPMSQWVVDLQELLCARLRELADASVASDFRLLLGIMRDTLSNEKEVEASDVSRANAFHEKHSSSFEEKDTQASICMLLDQVCRFVASRTAAAHLPVVRLARELHKCLCGTEQKKLGPLAAEHLELQEAMLFLIQKMAAVDDADFKILDSKWQDTIGAFARAATKLETLAADVDAPLKGLEQDAHMHRRV